MQRSGVFGIAGITLRPHAGKVPQLQIKSYYVQQQAREDERSRDSGAAEQTDRNSRTGSHEGSYAHGNGDEQSGAWS